MSRTQNAAAGLASATGSPRSPFDGLDVCAAAGLAVRPGGRPVMFTDQVWRFTDVEGLPVQMNPVVTRWDFTTVHAPAWRLVAKEYLFARLAPRQERVAVLPHAYRVPLTLWSCSARTNETVRWLNWLTGAEVNGLQDVTQAHCDRYLTERITRRDRAGTAVGTLNVCVARLAAAVIIELALYGELFTADRYREGFIPWNGRSSSQVAGMSRPQQNSTPVLDQHVLAPMLTAALYLTATLAPHIIELAEQGRQRQEHRARLPQTRITVTDLAAVLDHHVQTGLPLEAAPPADIQGRLSRGWDPADPLLGIRILALAHEAGVRGLPGGLFARARPLIEATAARVGAGKPWARHAVPVERSDNQGLTPWTLPLDPGEVRGLATCLNTACMLVTATVTGMRAGELMELRAGCRQHTTHGQGMVRHRLTSTMTKGQPLGGTSEEWTVVGEVDHAIRIAEQMTHGHGPDALLFGRFDFAGRYDAFREWVNGPAGQRLGLQPIPQGLVSLRMLRRTLAHELAYRPSGLLATKVHLKHVSVATTEGYANRPGGAQAKLLAEISELEGERNLQLVMAEYANYRDGVMPTGPGARDLIAHFAAIDDLTPADANHTRTAPNVIAGDQQILNLLTKRAGILHLAAANYCWFADPSRALCLHLAGTPNADKPLAGMCDSTRCPQATHHPCHRPVWEQTVTNTTTLLRSLGRTRKTERARLTPELERAQRILTAIDAAGPPAPSPTDHT